MITDVFASLISITKGLHRDKRTDREFRGLVRNQNVKMQYKQAPLFMIDFPERAFGDKRKYYKNLIDQEANKKFNEIVSSFPTNAIEEEHVFNYQKLFNQHHSNLERVKSYIDKYEHSRESIRNEDTFIIQYLKANMIWLYLELQERYAQYGNEDKFSVDELYKYFFQENLSQPEITQIVTTETKTTINKRDSKKQKTKSQAVPKVSFGFKDRNTVILESVLKQLTIHIDLIDEQRTKLEDFIALMTAKNFSEINTPIYLGCETTQFRYVLDALKPYFTNLNPKSIENTGLFYTKNSVELKANNLYKNKVHNPKSKTEIDSIINNLQ